MSEEKPSILVNLTLLLIVALVLGGLVWSGIWAFKKFTGDDGDLLASNGEETTVVDDGGAAPGTMSDEDRETMKEIFKPKTDKPAPTLDSETDPTEPAPSKPDNPADSPKEPVTTPPVTTPPVTTPPVTTPPVTTPPVTTPPVTTPPVTTPPVTTPPVTTPPVTTPPVTTPPVTTPPVTTPLVTTPPVTTPSVTPDSSPAGPPRPPRPEPGEELAKFEKGDAEAEDLRADAMRRIDEAPEDLYSPRNKHLVKKGLEAADRVARICTLYFTVSKDQLPENEIDRLRQAFSSDEMKELSTNPKVVFFVLGFADPSGPAALNKKLSMSRAQSVVELLTTQMNVKNKVHPVAIGPTEIISESNKEKNRAAEVWGVFP